MAVAQESTFPMCRVIIQAILDHFKGKDLGWSSNMRESENHTNPQGSHHIFWEQVAMAQPYERVHQMGLSSAGAVACWQPVQSVESESTPGHVSLVLLPGQPRLVSVHGGSLPAWPFMAKKQSKFKVSIALGSAGSILTSVILVRSQCRI